MRRRLIIVLLPILLVQCATYYKYIQKHSKFYTKEEGLILQKTTNAIDFGYGFDPDLELDYIYSFSHDAKELDSKKKNFADVVRHIDDNNIISYYEKIYRLKLLTLDKMDRSKNDYILFKRKWKNYTFIKKYLLPSLEKYFDILEENVLLRYNNQTIDKRKKDIERQLEEERRRIRYERLWKDDYAS